MFWNSYLVEIEGEWPSFDPPGTYRDWPTAVLMHWKGTSAEHASRSWFCGLLSVSQSSDLQALRIVEAECQLYAPYPNGQVQLEVAGPMPSAKTLTAALRRVELTGRAGSHKWRCSSCGQKVCRNQASCFACGSSRSSGVELYRENPDTASSASSWGRHSWDWSERGWSSWKGSSRWWDEGWQRRQ